MPQPPLARRRSALIALLGAALLGACGGETVPEGAAATPATVAASGEPAASAAQPAAATPVALAGAPEITVYKSPTCGCCNSWVDHLREHGFAVVERDTSDMAPIKAAHGTGGALESCHTGLVDGYVVEGHVPADLIARLITEKPEGVAGLAVPGMPMGSPGMEGPYKDAYDVLAFRKDGGTSVYARR